jgi:raffinose/stachyose/melibiose transport system permease protein
MRNSVRLHRGIGTKVENLLFTLPAVVSVVAMIYVPFVLSGYYSLTEWNGIAREAKFIGLDNFVRLFETDGSYLKSLVFTSEYTAVSIVALNVLALVLAMALVRDLKSGSLLRSLFFIPYILSMTIVGFIWQFIFSKGFDSLFNMTGFGFFNWSWLGDANIVFFSVVTVGVWQAVGFYMVIYIAGLQSIPADVLEAATMDGARGLTLFRRVTLPLLAPSITTCVLLSLINSLKVFDIILALTRGGPGGATYSATLEIYREAFQNNNYGFGSAKALGFFVLVLLLTFLVQRFFRSQEER